MTSHPALHVWRGGYAYRVRVVGQFDQNDAHGNPPIFWRSRKIRVCSHSQFLHWGDAANGATAQSLFAGRSVCLRPTLWMWKRLPLPPVLEPRRRCGTAFGGLPFSVPPRGARRTRKGWKSSPQCLVIYTGHGACLTTLEMTPPISRRRRPRWPWGLMTMRLAPRSVAMRWMASAGAPVA